MTLLTLLIILIATASAHAARPLPERIARTITATWACEQAVGWPRTRAGNVWAKHSIGYRRWQLRVWQTRLQACERAHTTIRVLRRGLAGTPVAGSETALEHAARRYRISPFFMAAVFATESSLGRVACRNDRFNVAGLASCQDSWPVPRFRSWPHFFDYYARFLTSRWPGATTPWSYRGYAACSDCWARKVAYWMHTLFGVDPNVRFP